MPRRIHVSSDMRAGGDLREVANVTLRDEQAFRASERRVARPVRHTVAERNGDVYEFSAHEAMEITFLIPPASFESGFRASSMENRAVINERTASGHFSTNVPRSPIAARKECGGAFTLPRIT